MSTSATTLPIASPQGSQFALAVQTRATGLPMTSCTQPARTSGKGHGEAFYVPSRDFISMPAFAGFKGADHFYNVVFHEWTHWTGHKSRLDRDFKNRFGSRKAPRSCVPNLVLTVTSGMRAISPLGLNF